MVDTASIAGAGDNSSSSLSATMVNGVNGSNGHSTTNGAEHERSAVAARNMLNQQQQQQPPVNKVTVVLGAQWGDEGKGKLVDLLAASAKIVCRCQVSRYEME